MSSSIRNDVAGALLSALASMWPNPVAARARRFGAEPGTLEYARAYAVDQYMRKVSNGFDMGAPVPPLFGKDVLELGCGHGGITCYLASLGVRCAVGIDINTRDLEIARELADRLRDEIGRDARLPVEFLEMDCMELTFDDGSFDVVVGDNLFEHVTDPEGVLRESYRVLRPGGFLLVPGFSSIWSKYGLHLKHGLKVPWANLVFSERTIVNAMTRQARQRAELYDLYPGLREAPARVRDLRRHRDLNDITYRSFRDMAARVGFRVSHFHVRATPLGRVVRRVVPAAGRTRALDVLSTAAAAVLQKPDA